MLSGVSREHQDIIEAFQPYRSDDPIHALSLLRDLSNIDKHRILQLVTMEDPPEEFDTGQGPYVAIGNLPAIPVLDMIMTSVEKIFDTFENVLREVPK
jgi:hypothetical protein